jgi:hypothetical protein
MDPASGERNADLYLPVIQGRGIEYSMALQNISTLFRTPILDRYNAIPRIKEA